MALFEIDFIRYTDTPSFTPCYSPVEMFSMGVFGGAYFQLPTTLPEEFLRDISVLPPQTGVPDRHQNRYKILGGASLEWWQKQGLMHQDDPNGWVEWFVKFHYGRRHTDDARQIKRWRSFIGRHTAMLRSYQKAGKDSVKTKQNLLQWSWNHEIDPT
jgi:hypothetical protein